MHRRRRLKELRRLQELERHHILDTKPEQPYDEIVALASAICNTPVALVSLIDQSRQWFKACIGFDIVETPREIAFCDYVVQQGETMVVEDATLDTRFADNPLVIGAPHIRFYAGIPLISDGCVLGTLCVIDFQPRRLSKEQLSLLQKLANQVLRLFELRSTVREIDEVSDQLENQVALYSSLVQHVQEVIFQTDKNGYWMFLSPAWNVIFDYDVESTISGHFIHYVHPDDRVLTLGLFKDLMSGSKQDCNSRIRMKNKKGHYNWVEIFARPTYSVDSEIEGATGTINDVTEKLLREKMIEDQRIQMIQSARLSSLGQMAAGIAHEINNPLAIIAATAQLLGRTHKDDQKVTDAVGKIGSTVQRISKIISGLRSFAREGGDDPYTMVAVQSIIGDALELCRTRMRSKGVKLDVLEPEADLVLECRSVQVAQAILNLLNNAFDAVEPCPTKIITIKVQEHEHAVDIKVLDSGPGVPPEIEERIMDPFFSTKGPTRGTGLGLSLSRGLIESHNGSLRYAREDDMSCFTISLPKKQQTKMAKIA